MEVNRNWDDSKDQGCSYSVRVRVCLVQGNLALLNFKLDLLV